MDRKLSKTREIERLTGIGDTARVRLGQEATLLKHRLDVPSRIRGSLKSHPTGWLLGSLAAGLAASLLFRRRPPPPEIKRRSLPITLLGLALTAIRPLAKVWLTDHVKNYLSGQLTAPSPLRYPTKSHHP